MGLLKKAGVAPNVETMREAASALGIELSNDESPTAMIADLRKAFDERLKDIDENDHIVCAKCGERTDDAPELTCCPFCGDEGSSDAEADAIEAKADDAGEEEGDAEPEVIEGEDIDPGEDAEEPPAANLDAPPAPAPAPAAETPAPAAEKPKRQESAPAAAETPKKGRKKADAPAAVPAAEPAPAPAQAAEPAKGKGRKKAPEGTALEKAADSALAKELAAEDKKIETAQRDIVGGSYDLGQALRVVHEKELWKAAGHKTFPQYLAAKNIGRTFAYDLMELTQKFDRKTFEEVGRKKLMLVARAGGPESEKGKDVLDKAKAGTPVRQLEADAKGGEAGGKTRGRHTVAEHERGGDKAPAKAPATAEDGKITLLAKVGGKPTTLPFLDRKTRQPVAAWAPETFAEVKISEDVSMFLALKTDKEGKPVGVTVAYKRATTEAAAAE